MRNILPFFAFLLSACAQVVTPSGGPADNTAPVVVKYIPDSAAVNTKPKRIRIEFDEYVQLKEVSKQVIVSPLLKQTPDISASGKVVTVEIEDTLQDNTTYTINFGTAITDITEFNPKKGFTYVFSTGPTIDTTSLSGYIKNAFTGKPEADFTVILYKNLNDSAPYKSRPHYYTRTGQDGSFSFKNLKPDTYKLFSLKDANSNFKPDPDESIAFIAEPFTISKDSTIFLSSFTEVPARLFLKASNFPAPGRIDLVFSRPADSIRFEFPEAAKDLTGVITEFSSQKDSVRIFYSTSASDSVIIQLSKGTYRDTLEKKLAVATQFKGKKPFSVERTNLDQFNFLNSDTLQITFNLPLALIDTSRIYFKVKPNGVKPALVQPPGSRTLRIPVFAGRDSVQTIRLQPGAITAITGKTNDSISYNFRKKPGASTGSAKLNFTTAISDDFVIQLVNEAGQVIAESFSKDGKATIQLKLDAGAYTARAIRDRNRNRKWDPGRYSLKQQAEDVYIFEKKLTVRQGWDLEESWELK